MEFKIHERKNPHVHKYEKNELDLAMEFARQAMQEFGTFVKAIVLFGSTAKKRKQGQKESHDIDILVLLNDVNNMISQEAWQTYKVVCANIIQKVSNKIHVTELMITNFWELIRSGDPIVINMLRDGVAIIDSGIFEPMQVLLYRGRIRPTWESIWTYYHRAPHSLMNAKRHLLHATVDLYWCVIDSSHAALMKMGEIPPSPSHVADMLEKKLYPKHIKKKHVTIMRDFYHLSKHIMRGEITEIAGKDYDRYVKDAQDVMEVMKGIIEGK